MHDRKVLIYALLKAQAAGRELDDFISELHRLAEKDLGDKGKGRGKHPALLTQVRRIIEEDFPHFMTPKPHEYEAAVLGWDFSAARKAQAASHNLR